MMHRSKHSLANRKNARAPKWKPAESEKAFQLLDEGKTYSQIAAALGRTRCSVAGHLNRADRFQGQRP